MTSLTFLQAIVLGIVEGLTEFLPISSTFHLIFAAQVMGIEATEFVKVFEVFIQAGAILSVLFLYGKSLLTDWELNKKVVASFIPTALVGLVFHSTIKNVFFESNQLMLGAFVMMGLVFIGYEWWLKKHHRQPDGTIEELSYKQAVIVGLCQSMAIIPGVSRAGAVMLGLMFLGVSRKEAARYSFILAVPTICAAAVLDVVKMRHEILASSSAIPLLLVGTVVSFVVASGVLVWFIRFLQNNTLTAFGWYRLAAAAVLLGLLMQTI